MACGVSALTTHVKRAALPSSSSSSFSHHFDARPSPASSASSSHHIEHTALPASSQHTAQHALHLLGIIRDPLALVTRPLARGDVVDLEIE